VYEVVTPVRNPLTFRRLVVAAVAGTVLAMIAQAPAYAAVIKGNANNNHLDGTAAPTPSTATAATIRSSASAATT